MLDVMRFWFDKGVDGFRVDALWHVIKDAHYRDNPLDPDYVEGKMPPYERYIGAYSGGQPELPEIVGLLRHVADQYKERVLIGEMYLPIEELMGYYGLEQDTGLHLPYNFQLILLPWKAVEIFAGINRYEASLPSFAWPNWVLGNHDKPRVATRVGAAQARIAALLLLTLRGTPTIYYGDEIGMHNVPIPPQRERDPVGRLLDSGKFCRDPERTPMQWNAGPGAGFTTGEPWLPVADDYGKVNVEAQQQDDGSMLVFYRKLLELRRREPALQTGAYLPAGQKKNLFAFVRELGDNGFLIAVNLASTRARLDIPKHLDVTGEVVLGTDPKRVGDQISQHVNLGPHEGLIARIKPCD